VQYQVIN